MTDAAVEKTPEEYGIVKGPSHKPIYPTGIADLKSFDTYTHGVPHAVFDTLREKAPVYWSDEAVPWGKGFWSLTKHEDLVYVSKNPKLFSSESGFQIDFGDPSFIDEYMHKAVVNNMLGLDPPVHQTYRKLASPGFSGSALAKLQGRIRAYTRKLIADMAPKGEAEFVSEFSSQLPVYVLAIILGVPMDDMPKLIRWTDAMIELTDPDFPMENYDAQIGEIWEMFEYGKNKMAKRRLDPRDDMMSLVANGEVDGERVPEVYLDGFFQLLVVAGNETTRNTTSGMMSLFSKHPEQKQKLLDDWDLLPLAVDEGLRHVTPVIHMIRTATQDLEMHGQKIAAGDKIALWYPGANRDPDVFEDPHRFDVTRTSAIKHLAFGIGEHFCLGSRLARLQLHIMFEELLKALPDIETTAEPKYIRSNFLAGISELPVKFTPRTFEA